MGISYMNDIVLASLERPFGTIEPVSQLEIMQENPLYNVYFVT